jgi:hypothetical protein
MARPELDRLNEALALLEAWRVTHSSPPFTDRLDNSFVVLSGPVTDFLADAQRFSELRGRAEFEVSQGAWRARIWTDDGVWDLEPPGGPWDEAFADDQQIADAQAAADAGQARRLLELCGGLSCEATFSIRLHVSEQDCHWIRTTEALLAYVRTDTWLGWLQAMRLGVCVPRLIVNDAGDSEIAAPSLLIHGPGIYPTRGAVPVSAGANYAQTWLSQSQNPLPSPEFVEPHKAEGLDAVRELLCGAAHALVWLWLASNVDIDATNIRAHFEGTPIDVDLTEPLPSSHTDKAIALWRWAVASADPLRREALLQSISLSVRRPDDIGAAAERVRRQASYLWHLAQQGRVAEALAARRAAREAAIGAARTATDAIGTALRSFVNRAVAQIAAAIGILLANTGSLINRSLAGWLLVAVFSMVSVTGAVAFLIDYPGVRDTLDGFRADLSAYSDVLSEEDLNEIGGLTSLTNAKSQLVRARWFTGVLVGVAIATLLVLRYLVSHYA